MKKANGYLIGLLSVGLLFAVQSPRCFGQLPQDPDSLKMLLKIAPDTTRQDALTELAWHYVYTEPDSTLGYGKDALRLARDLDDLYRETKALTVLGVMYAMNGGYPQALEHFLTTLEINEELELDKNIARSAINVGNMLKEQKNYDDAQHYYQRTLEIAQNLQDTAMIAVAYVSLGNNLQDQQRFEASLGLYQRALSLVADRPDTPLMVPIHVNMGTAYDHLNSFKKAIYHARQALGAMQTVGHNPDYAISAQRIMAHAYLHSDQTDSAMACAQRALRAAQEFRNPEFEAEALETLSEVYEQEGNYAQALAYHQQHATLQDSILNKTITRQMAQTQTLYETHKKNQAIETLQQEQALQQAKMDRERNLRYGILAAVVLLLGLLAVLYSRYRLKQRALRTISEQKNRIEQQNALITDKNRENEVLLREIHHRVKNNLQLILSLLNIQSRQFDDEAVLNFVRDGQNRVRSMALIHQDLYQAQRLDRVRFDYYLKQLTDHLKTVYQTERRSIFVRIRAEPVQLDVNTAVPLGLIVNELVSNALKHAFSDAGGQVDIVLAGSAEHHCRLVIADNGTGLSEAAHADSMGLKLVQGLVRQLGGTLQISTETGSRFKIAFLAKPLTGDNPVPAVDNSPSAETSVS